MNSSKSNHEWNILVVGVGSIGERHVRCFQKTGRARVSICETNDRLLGEISSRYNVSKQYSNLEVALAEQHDAVVIAVPADLHIDVAQKAVDAGLNILIEKPLAVTLDGVDALAESVARAKVVAAVGYVYRAHPALAAMKNAIAAGSLGTLVQVVVVAGQNFPTYRPTYRDSYYVSHARGGGAIQDAMTHVVNAAEWLVGPIEALVADADHKVLVGVEVEDVVNVLARHENVIGSYSLNQYQSPNEVTITVIGDRGTARFEYHKQRWRLMSQPDQPWHDERATDLDRDTLFVRQAESFLNAIERRSAPLCSLDEGAQSLRVNLALMKSIERNEWQHVTNRRLQKE